MNYWTILPLVYIHNSGFRTNNPTYQKIISIPIQQFMIVSGSEEISEFVHHNNGQIHPFSYVSHKSYREKKIYIYTSILIYKNTSLCNWRMHMNERDQWHELLCILLSWRNSDGLLPTAWINLVLRNSPVMFL